MDSTKHKGLWRIMVYCRTTLISLESSWVFFWEIYIPVYASHHWRRMALLFLLGSQTRSMLFTDYEASFMLLFLLLFCSPVLVDNLLYDCSFRNLFVPTGVRLLPFWAIQTLVPEVGPETSLSEERTVTLLIYYSEECCEISGALSWCIWFLTICGTLWTDYFPGIYE